MYLVDSALTSISDLPIERQLLVSEAPHCRPLPSCDGCSQNQEYDDFKDALELDIKLKSQRKRAFFEALPNKVLQMH